MTTTARQLYRATWIPHPVPEGEREELLVWSTEGYLNARLLTAVRVDEEIFVLCTRPIDPDTVVECWKILDAGIVR